MPRFVEITEIPKSTSPLTVEVSDVLFVRACGGHVREGAAVLELLGHYIEAVVGTTGGVLAPAGAPNVMLARALKPGSAVLEVVTGDLWHSVTSTSLSIQVIDPLTSTPEA